MFTVRDSSTLCVFISELSISDPYFNGNDSFMAFTAVFIKLSTEITIQVKPEKPSGFLLYATQHHHTFAGDFLSLVLVDGFAELRFNLGSGLIKIRSNSKLEAGKIFFLMTLVATFSTFEVPLCV